MKPNKTSIFKKIILYHLPFIIYAALIIIISSIPHLKQPYLRFLAVDKIAHFIEYSLFAVLTLRSFSNLSTKLTVNHSLILSFVFLAIFAVLDEFYQRYIPGRYFDIGDIAIDLFGAFLVLLLLGKKLKNVKEPTS